MLPNSVINYFLQKARDVMTSLRLLQETKETPKTNIKTTVMLYAKKWMKHLNPGETPYLIENK